MRSVLEYRLAVMLGVASAIAIACGDLKTADQGAEDGGPTPAGGTDSPGTDRDAFPDDSEDGGRPDGTSGVAPADACRKIPLDCLDPAAANVIEVPTESTLRDALTNAKSGDTVQVRGSTLGSGWRVPPYVTLRGCEGAKISGTISFAGSGGTIEGFYVSGSVVANETGTFVVRYDRFITGAANEAAVSGRSIDALVSASVTLVVDSSSFESRDLGIEARTNYDTGTHQVDITVRNSVFAHVTRPIVASKVGLVGLVNATIEHNTFYDFDTAVRLTDVDASTSGNLLVKGDKGIEGTDYDVAYSFTWQVATPAATPPRSGTFATGDPAFVDTVAGDFRLGAASAVVDRIPSSVPVPGEDYLGCPRPAGAPGAPAQSDVGAFESQP